MLCQRADVYARYAVAAAASSYGSADGSLRLRRAADAMMLCVYADAS